MNNNFTWSDEHAIQETKPEEEHREMKKGTKILIVVIIIFVVIALAIGAVMGVQKWSELNAPIEVIPGQTEQEGQIYQQ